LKRGGFEFNKYALSLAGLFFLFLVVKFAPHCELSCPTMVLVYRDAAAISLGIAGGIAGLMASRSFGGRKNFTGKLLFFFSLLIFIDTVSLILGFLDFYYNPTPLLNWLSYRVLLPYSGISEWISVLEFSFPAYAFLVSLRSMGFNLDLKSLIVVTLSLVTALFVGWVNLAYGACILTICHLPFVLPESLEVHARTFADSILWMGISPILTFVNLAAGILLLRSLGRWYVARRITVLVSAFLFFSIFIQLLNSVILAWLSGWTSSLPTYPNFDAAAFYYGVLYEASLYLVCITLTQIKPRTTGRYF